MSRHHKPLIADTILAATTGQLKKWIAEGRLRIDRVDKSGRIVSIGFDPGDGKGLRHVRVSTLQRLVAIRGGL